MFFEQTWCINCVNNAKVKKDIHKLEQQLTAYQESKGCSQFDTSAVLLAKKATALMKRDLTEIKQRFVTPQETIDIKRKTAGRISQSCCTITNACLILELISEYIELTEFRNLFNTCITMVKPYLSLCIDKNTGLPVTQKNGTTAADRETYELFDQTKSLFAGLSPNQSNVLIQTGNALV